MNDTKIQNRYKRIYRQLTEILPKTTDKLARMSTIVALLHNKMDHYFWTGYYLLKEGKLVVGPYQGPVACQELEKDTGVCWAGINKDETVIVPDVHKFPGHIACDSRSQSEIVIPLKDDKGKTIGVLDIDSKEKNSFNETDKNELIKILELINK